jgi:hypothetical protein
MSVGIDLTEIEFDLRNQQITDAIRNEPDFNDNLFTTYALKNCPTQKGYWMQIVSGFEKYFTNDELESAVDYIPLNEETIEL